MEDLDNMDYFDDGDLAEAENIPEKSECLGTITAVDCSKANGPDNWQAWGDGSKHPIIQLTVQARCFASGEPFDFAKNYMRQARVNFAVGKGDFGKPQLAKLAKKLLAASDDDLKTQKMTEIAGQLVNGKVKFTVKWSKMKEGDGFFQNFNNLKAATDAEVALLA